MIIVGDAAEKLRELADESVHACVTSPPYWGLRDYGVPGQLGLEKTPEEYVGKLIDVFREVRRVLRKDGTLWLNLGDSYAGSWGNQSRKEHRGKQRAITKEMLQNFEPYGNLDKASGTGSLSRTPGLKNKDLVGIPWRVAFALQADGWYLRSDIIWHKPNPMPESVTDRPTKSHEYIFLLAKSEKYFYDIHAAKEAAVSDTPSGNGFKRNARLTYKDENGARGSDKRWLDVGGTRNRRTVWTVTTKPFKGAHFATFPPDLIEPCIKAGCPEMGTVIDPFFGAGTTGVVATRLNRKFIGIELNPTYAAMARERIGLLAF